MANKSGVSTADEGSVIGVAGYPNQIIRRKFRYGRTGRRLRLATFCDSSLTQGGSTASDVHGTVRLGGCDSVYSEYIHAIYWGLEHSWDGSQVGILGNA